MSEGDTERVYVVIGYRSSSNSWEILSIHRTESRARLRARQEASAPDGWDRTHVEEEVLRE